MSESKPTVSRQVTGLIGLLALLAILIAVNLMADRLKLRRDITEDRSLSVSDGTRNILSRLDRDLAIKFYISRSASEFPLEWKDYASRVTDLLDEYSIYADGRITIERYDPKPDSDEELAANNYGVSGRPVSLGGPPMYMGLAVVSGDKHVPIPFLEPANDAALEYNLTRAITEVTNPSKKVLGVISSLPVMGSQMQFQMPGQPPPQPPFANIQQLRRNYELRDLSGAQEIPADVQALLIVHPRMLSDRTLYEIDQFLLRGGNLMVLVDPSCFFERRAMGQQGMGQPTSSTLGPLFEAWGVTYSSTEMVGDPTAIFGDGGQLDLNLTWLALNNEHRNRDDLITAHLDAMIMLEAGTVTATSDEKRTVTPLLTTGASANTISVFQAMMPPDALRREFNIGKNALPLAIRLTGSFKTAFPDGRPDETGAEDTPDVTPLVSLKESQKDAAIIVVADADMFFDDVSFSRQQTPFGVMLQQLNANFTFLANGVEQLMGSTDLISIRSRARTDRSFVRVRNLAQKAQEEHLGIQQALNERIQNIQSELNAMDIPDGAIIPDAVIREKTKKLEADLREAEAERRELSKTLREDIEDLGLQVKLLNILMMPGVVIFVGICFAIIRRSKTGK